MSITNDASSAVPQWRTHIAQALAQSQDKPEARYLQFATTDEQGCPSVRTVVFRGFVPDNDKFIVHTDCRSEKIRHLNHFNNVQLCWYFALTREQFRVTGHIDVIDNLHKQGSQLRSEQWQGISSAAKASYAGKTPGALMPLDDIHQATVEEDSDLESVNDNFVVLLLTPTRVEHLQLTTTPHTRNLYRFEQGTWLQDRINP